MATQRRARRQRTIRIRIVAALTAVAAVVVLVVKNVNDRNASRRIVSQLTAGSCTFDRRSDGGSSHVTSPTYRLDPPSGGDHTATAAQAGVYDEANVPPDGQIVHAMEHGYVILWHRPDLTQSDQAAVDDIGLEFDRDVLVVPRRSLEVPIAATAWHRRLLCPQLERDALTQFVESYRNKGPEKVPH